MTIIHFLLLLVAGICGARGYTIAGSLCGGWLTSIAPGFIVRCSASGWRGFCRSPTVRAANRRPGIPHCLVHPAPPSLLRCCACSRRGVGCCENADEKPRERRRSDGRRGLGQCGRWKNVAFPIAIFRVISASPCRLEPVGGSHAIDALQDGPVGL